MQRETAEQSQSRHDPHDRCALTALVFAGVSAFTSSCNREPRVKGVSSRECVEGELDSPEWTQSATHTAATSRSGSFTVGLGTDPLTVVIEDTVVTIDSTGAAREDKLSLDGWAGSVGAGVGVVDRNGDGQRDLFLAGSRDEPGAAVFLSPFTDGDEPTAVFLEAPTLGLDFGVYGLGEVRATDGEAVLVVGQPRPLDPEHSGIYLLRLDSDAGTLAKWGHIASTDRFPSTGDSLDSRGDLDGDGLLDIVHADIMRSVPGPLSGVAFVHYGPVPPTSTVEDADVQFGPSSSVNFGWSISSGEDVDGDGLDDVAVASTYWSQAVGLTTEETRIDIFTHAGLQDGEPRTTVRVPGRNIGAVESIELSRFSRSAARAGLFVHDGGWPGEWVEDAPGGVTGTVFGWPELPEGTVHLCDAPLRWEARAGVSDPRSTRGVVDGAGRRVGVVIPPVWANGQYTLGVQLEP